MAQRKTGGLKARVDGLAWTADETFTLDGLNFRYDPTFKLATSADEVVLLKPKSFFDLYADVLGDAPTRRVLDLGIWQGGSALAFAALFEAEQLSAIDICDPLPALDAVLASHPLGRRISLHYQTSQDDEAALKSIIAAFDGPIDLVVDDASHLYAQTRRTFEVVFPHLAPGGWYVIEDWAWAHMLWHPVWLDEPSLANLTFRLLLAWVASPSQIAEVIVKPSAVFVRKPLDAPVGGVPLDLDSLYLLHHRKFELIA